MDYAYGDDLAGRVQRMYGSDGYKLRNIYDAKGNIYNTLYTFADNDYITAYSNNYIYGDDNRIDTVRFNQTGVEIGRTYDGLGRVTKKEYSKNGVFFTTEYSFLAGVNGNTTGILSSVTNNNETISYTYDDNGNIATISEGNTEKARYAYDGLNQLVREDNKYLNKSITYSYDAGGNLTSKKEYPYTIEALGTPIRTINYTYGDSNWKDKLTAYNGKTITYDAIGNPLAYDGNTFAWTGRQLDSITNSNDSISYTYNADGIRTSKTVNGLTTKYFLHGDRITLEKVGNEDRAFWYDGDGNAAAFVIYDAEGKHPYYYMRNGQDDIIGLFDVTGAVVARYTYDSWGKLVSITDGNGNDKTNDTSFVGYKNPLRYRGYYYDNETGLYYLQSRYYNPEWGRFLNADAITTSSLLGTNLFAYCNNNPVMYHDPTGHCPFCNNEYYHPANMSQSAWEQHLKTCSDRPQIIAIHQSDKRKDETISIYVTTSKKAAQTFKKGAGDIIIVDERLTHYTNGNIDPNMIVMDTYLISDYSTMKTVASAMIWYNLNTHQEGALWQRSVESIIDEWNFHNLAYNLNFQRDRTADTDFNNLDEGKNFFQFIFEKAF